MKDSQNIDPAAPRSDHGRYLVRKSGRRFSILETTLMIALLGIVLTAVSGAFSDRRIEAKVNQAIESVADARGSFEDSCKEGIDGSDAAPPSPNTQGSEPEPEIALPAHVRDIIIEPIGTIESQARRISIVFAGIGGEIEEGDRLVFTGHCRKGSIEWSVGGDLPLKYRPSR
ncbi:MAG: hypothetical protein ISN28_01045 [Ectothiorhodospiraceae bacterium AqS1]|nr:hypothetical protein [Ectothiorhodospiraceae bacterium AqS1]